MKRNVIIISAVALTTIGIWWYVKKRKNGQEVIPSGNNGNGKSTKNGSNGKGILPGEMDQNKNKPTAKSSPVSFTILSSGDDKHTYLAGAELKSVPVKPGDKVYVESDVPSLNGVFPVDYIYTNNKGYQSPRIKWDWPFGAISGWESKKVNGTYFKV